MLKDLYASNVACVLFCALNYLIAWPALESELSKVDLNVMVLMGLEQPASAPSQTVILAAAVSLIVAISWAMLRIVDSLEPRKA